MADYSDKELIEQYKNGSNPKYAFNLMVQKYQERLYWHIRKIVISHEDTDDALQNTFVNAWKGIKNFREDASLFTWLYRIATNEALALIKKKRSKYFLPLVDVEQQLSQSLESDEYYDGDEIQKKLQKAILMLPEKQRVVFNMKYYDEMKYEDMAEILDTSVGALKASYHHAVKKIEKILSNN